MASRLDVLDLAGAVERAMYNAGAKESGFRDIYAAYKELRPELKNSPRYREFNRRIVKLRLRRNELSHGTENPKTGLKERYEPSDRVLQGLVEDGLFVLNYLEALEAARAEGVPVSEAEVKAALAPKVKQAAKSDEDISAAYAQAKAWLERETIEHESRVAAPVGTSEQPGPRIVEPAMSTPVRPRADTTRQRPLDPQTVEVKERIAATSPKASEKAEGIRFSFEEEMRKARRKRFFMAVAKNLWSASKWLAIKYVQLALR